MNADIWNVLHDGSILKVSGTVPGVVQFAVWIDTFGLLIEVNDDTGTLWAFTTAQQRKTSICVVPIEASNKTDPPEPRKRVS